MQFYKTIQIQQFQPQAISQLTISLAMVANLLALTQVQTKFLMEIVLLILPQPMATRLLVLLDKIGHLTPLVY